jgi:hypothetical protein
MKAFVRWQVAASSAGAAAIHFVVAPEHYNEWWAFGAFFFVVAWFQVAWSVAVVRLESRRVVLAGLLVNAIVIVIWIWSRTAGLPIGPEAGTPEAIGAPDVVSTLLEALVVIWTTALVGGLIPSRVAFPRMATATTILVWACVIAATAFAIVAQATPTMSMPMH